VQAGTAVLAETPGDRVLSLAVNGLDELADVVEAGDAAAVDGLVHLAEASGLRWCSAGRGGEAERCKSSDGSRGEHALHVTSLQLVVLVHPSKGASRRGVDQIGPHGSALTAPDRVTRNLISGMSVLLGPLTNDGYPANHSCLWIVNLLFMRT